MDTEKANNLVIYNTLSRRKEAFEPLHPPLVGMYVCGPLSTAIFIGAIAARSSLLI